MAKTANQIANFKKYVVGGAPRRGGGGRSARNRRVSRPRINFGNSPGFDNPF